MMNAGTQSFLIVGEDGVCLSEKGEKEFARFYPAVARSWRQWVRRATRVFRISEREHCKQYFRLGLITAGMRPEQPKHR